MTTFTWLHLSDFHFKAGGDLFQDRALDCLSRHVFDKLPSQGISPDVVVVSGNIAWSGKDEEYRHAAGAFEKIAGNLGLEPTNSWFMVPGNRDVDLESINPFQKQQRDLFNEENTDHFLAEPETWAAFTGRQKAWFDFTEHFLGRRWQATQPWNTEIFDKDGYKIALACLNSAWCSQGDDRGHLLLGRHQVGHALEKARDADLRIAICHHPLDYLKAYDKDHCFELLSGRDGFHLLLRGHLRSSIQQIGNPGGTLFELAAGACWQKARHPHSVMVGQVDFARHQLHLYAWSHSERQGGFWTPDHQLYQGMKYGRYSQNFPKGWGSIRATPKYVNTTRENDFILQPDLEKLNLIPDCLRHDKIARSISGKISAMGSGNVIAIQGRWGRGKTDILMRLAKMQLDALDLERLKSRGKDLTEQRQKQEECDRLKPLWINPWQYGTPDLLTPLVEALLDRVPDRSRVETVARDIIRSGYNFGYKAFPAGQGATLPTGPVQGESSEMKHSYPVTLMGKHFRKLVEAILPPDSHKNILVFIDDLDRCLPHRQIALLEALRFLVSGSARVTFLIALDPLLVKQAVETYYNSQVFDPDLYLDKMFHLRLNLPALSDTNVTNLIESGLGQDLSGVTLRTLIRRQLGQYFLSFLENKSARIWPVINLKNPRVVHKVIQRIRLLCLSQLEPAFRAMIDEHKLKFLFWLALCERWPEIRHTIQDAGDHMAYRFAQVHDYYVHGHEPEAVVATLKRLPRSEHTPELIHFFANLELERDPRGPEAFGKVIAQLDRFLIEEGL